MTKLFEAAVEAVRRMPPDVQDAIARMLLLAAHDEDNTPLEIPVEDLPDVMQALAEADRGEFASDEEVVVAFRRFEG